MIDTYTRLLEAVADTRDTKVADTAVTKLIAHLKSRGRMNMLPGLVHELRKVAARREALVPKVEVATEQEAAKALKEAASAGIVAEKAEVNPALIRGWRARGDGKLMDRSAKQALLQIYKKVTD